MIQISALIPRGLVAEAHRQPKIRIDQTEAFADLGSLTPSAFADAAAVAGRAAALSGVARRAQEGGQLGRIEVPEASIRAVVAAATAVPWPQLVPVALPAHRPRISVELGEWRWAVVPPMGVWLDAKV